MRYSLTPLILRRELRQGRFFLVGNENLRFTLSLGGTRYPVSIAHPVGFMTGTCFKFNRVQR